MINVDKHHLQVLITLYEFGRINKHEMKVLRKKLFALKSFNERETFLKGVIYETRNKKIKN